MQWRLPRWLARMLSALGFAAFFALQVHGLWYAKPNFPRTFFSAIYLFVVFGFAIAIDRALADKTTRW